VRSLSISFEEEQLITSPLCGSPLNKAYVNTISPNTMTSSLTVRILVEIAVIQ
jgi:hypothetical protein